MNDTQERLVNPDPRDEDSANFSLRPQLLNEMIGQEKIKENIAILIEAA
ncbi:MAG TPA: Holliday junction branch migration DNA helicase RuvB, partial [Chloroflexi bacterium]|nr:Holliday junction branch migration DNA helicase RuvB [Chloroflexota bacterium]